MYKAENEARLSLEQNLQQVSSYFDETQYNILPTTIRQSLEKSLRLSENFQKRFDSSTPINVTQSDLEELSSPAKGNLEVVMG